MHTRNLILPSVTLENIPFLWAKNDILIFFIDMNSYDSPGTEFLDNNEKENLEKLQTLYFKKRFIVSRTVLKHILCCLLNKESSLDISTYKDRHGEVRIFNHDDLHICISYSENIAAIAISRVKIGIDIEIKRPFELKKTLKYLHNTPFYSGKPVDDVGILKAWTLKEAYCKYSNIDMLSSLNKKPGLDNVSYFNFLLNGKYILSIVTEMGQHIFNLSYLDLSYLDLSYLDLSCLEKINSYQGEAVWKTTENLSKQE
ncbi:MAG: hypothetical protein EWM50_08215 [Gottschalkiaceae bacterium]|nr:MAG: hypothetical protein EWM50_08215 [Gottschalkiaceae bacterium]